MGVESVEMVADSAEVGEAVGTLGCTEPTADALSRARFFLAFAVGDAEAIELGDTPADTLGPAVGVGVAEGVVAGFFVDFPPVLADLGLDCLDALVGFAAGAAVLVTTGATPGDRVPAELCQAKATEPPAGTSSESTPTEA